MEENDFMLLRHELYIFCYVSNRESIKHLHNAKHYRHMSKNCAGCRKYCIIFCTKPQYSIICGTHIVLQNPSDTKKDEILHNHMQ